MGGGAAVIVKDGVSYVAGANSGTSENNSCDYGSVDEYARLSNHFSWISSVLNDGGDDDCVDSRLRFKQGRRTRRTCKWVKKNPNRCNQQGVADHCPRTCNQCGTCADSGTRWMWRRKWRDCNWVAQSPDNRCEPSQVTETCRLTCGACQID